jgi:hypothetical protein
MARAEAFDDAFDALDGNDRSLERLEQATDKLMRAAARVLIELQAGKIA